MMKAPLSLPAALFFFFTTRSGILSPPRLVNKHLQQDFKAANGSRRQKGNTEEGENAGSHQTCRALRRKHISFIPTIEKTSILRRKENKLK